jgi:hypothetical protein
MRGRDESGAFAFFKYTAKSRALPGVFDIQHLH